MGDPLLEEMKSSCLIAPGDVPTLAARRNLFGESCGEANR